MGHGDLSQRPPSPSCSPGRSPVTPGSLLQHLWCSPWNPPRLSWLSCSLSQISFSKAFHSVWMTASGSHQLDVLFLFSSESLLLPLISHQQGGRWEQKSLFRWCVTIGAGRAAALTVGEACGVFSPVRHPGGLRVWRQAGGLSSVALEEGGHARPSLFPGSPSPKMSFGN